MNTNDRSVATLLPELASEVTALIKSESDLLRTELDQKVQQAETAAGSLIAGALCLFAALLVLLQAIVVALTNAGLGAGWASLLVGVIVAAVGAGLLYSGSSGFANLTPKRSVNEARRTADMAREKTR